MMTGSPRRWVVRARAARARVAPPRRHAQGGVAASGGGATRRPTKRRRAPSTAGATRWPPYSARRQRPAGRLTRPVRARLPPSPTTTTTSAARLPRAPPPLNGWPPGGPRAACQGAAPPPPPPCAPVTPVPRPRPPLSASPARRARHCLRVRPVAGCTCAGPVGATLPAWTARRGPKLRSVPCLVLCLMGRPWWGRLVRAAGAGAVWRTGRKRPVVAGGGWGGRSLRDMREASSEK